LRKILVLLRFSYRHGQCVKKVLSSKEAGKNQMKLESIVSQSPESKLAPIVFLHAYPLNAEMWQSQLTALIPERTVIAMNFRGYGTSSAPPDEPFTIAQFASDVIETLDDQQIAAAIFAGCSIGGYTVFEIWRQAKERVLGMMLIDTRAEADTDDARKKRQAQIEKIQTEGAGFLQQAIVDSLMARGIERSHPEVVEKVKMWVSAVSPSVLIRTIEALGARADSGDTLKAITVPALILVGEHDEATPQTNAQRMLAGIPRAHLAVIPGAGHFSPLEAASAVNAEILRFLTEFF
jgi:3-oxoadipate enol-lactonase